MSLQSTAIAKILAWLSSFWTAEVDVISHGFASFIELSKPIVAGISPEVWVTLNHAYKKALADVEALDFTDVIPDVLTIAATEGLQEGVHFVSAELEAILTLLTKGGTVNPVATLAPAIDLKAVA